MAVLFDISDEWDALATGLQHVGDHVVRMVSFTNLDDEVTDALLTTWRGFSTNDSHLAIPSNFSKVATGYFVTPIAVNARSPGNSLPMRHAGATRSSAVIAPNASNGCGRILL